MNVNYESVFYLLHGNNDTASGWTDVGEANFVLDNLLAQKKAMPMIIVMPWGHAMPYAGSQSNLTGLATIAGRIFADDWSENGKGSSTTAPRS